MISPFKFRSDDPPLIDGFPIQLPKGPWGIDTNPNPNPWNIDDVDFGVIHPPGIDGGGLGARGQDDNVDDLWKSGGTGSIDGEGFGMGIEDDGGDGYGGEFDIGEERTGIHPIYGGGGETIIYPTPGPGIGNENFDGITGGGLFDVLEGYGDFIEPIDPGPIGPIMNVTEVMDMVNGGTNDG